MKDASLSDFLDDESEREAHEEADPAPAEEEADVPDGEDGTATDGPAVTAAWSAEGTTCGGCGETVGRVWTDGDRRVCRTCKDW